MDQFENQMNSDLRDLVMSLIPKEEYLKTGKELVEKVVSKIKSQSKFRVDREVYGGSMGKATGILYSDFDSILFINEKVNDFKMVLEDWEDILLMDETLKIDDKSIKRTKITLQFKFIGSASGFEVDLLPGVNFVPQDKPKLGGEELANAQFAGVTKVLRPTNSAHYSASLVETTVLFFKRQSEFTHQVVRLGKFWFKTLYLGPRPIYGVKLALDLICVYAGINEDGREPPSLLRAFATFLDRVAMIDGMQLYFEKDGDKWMIGNNKSRKSHWGHNYIIDPCNEFNNLVENFERRRKEVENLKKFATITRQRIRAAIDAKVVKSVFELFLPLPSPMYKEDELQQIPVPVILAGCDSSYRSMFFDMKIHNNKIFAHGPIMNTVLEVTKMCLCNTVHTAVLNIISKRETVTLEKVRTMACCMMNVVVYGLPSGTPWHSVTGERHEDYDCTFTIPINSSVGALKTSFRWASK